MYLFIFDFLFLPDSSEAANQLFASVAFARGVLAGGVFGGQSL